MHDDAQMDDDENKLVRDRWVCIACEHTSDGVWDREGCAALAEDLPIDQGLRDRLLAWQARFDSEVKDFMGWRGFEPDDILRLLASLSNEGLAIAIDVKTALPDWTVMYVDELAGHRLRWGRGHGRYGPPRTAWRFEIVRND